MLKSNNQSRRSCSISNRLRSKF